MVLKPNVLDIFGLLLDVHAQGMYVDVYAHFDDKPPVLRDSNVTFRSKAV